MMDDSELEQYFKAARSAPARVTDDLAARVLADAEAVGSDRARSARRAAPRQFGIGGVASLLGGWRGLAGLGAAAAAGLAIGFVQPETLSSLTGNPLDMLEAPGTFGLGFEAGGGLDILLQEEG